MESRFKGPDKMWAVIGLVLALAFLLGGVSVLGWQLYHWLDLGQWQPISLIDLLEWGDGPGSRAWTRKPEHGIGVWKILNVVPVSVLLGGIGLLAIPEALKHYRLVVLGLGPPTR